MTYLELKELTLEKIEEKKRENKTMLQKMKLSHAITPIENPIKIKMIRRLIARINTLLREKKINKSSYANAKQ